MTTLAQIASQFNDAIIQNQRADGTRYYALKDGAPEWMRDAVREAHDEGDMLPNDISYSMIDDVAGVLAETDPDEWMDVLGERCGDLAEQYGNETAWLASHSRRVGFVEDAVAEFGMPNSRGFNLYSVISNGIRAEYEMIWVKLSTAFATQADAE